MLQDCRNAQWRGRFRVAAADFAASARHVGVQGRSGLFQLPRLPFPCATCKDNGAIDGTELRANHLGMQFGGSLICR
jgi:hypothetical protein